MNFHECVRQSTSLLGISTAAKLSLDGAHVRAFRCMFSPNGAVEHHDEEHCGLSSHVCPSWVSRCCPSPRSDCGTGAAESFQSLQVLDELDAFDLDGSSARWSHR